MSYISISIQSGAMSATFSRSSTTQQDVDDAKAFLDGITVEEPLAAEAPAEPEPA